MLPSMEAIAHNNDGLPDFNYLRSKRRASSARLFVFDLLSIESTDLRARPTIERRACLAEFLDGAPNAIWLLGRF
jgi:ATP-dependent DNA ligase